MSDVQVSSEKVVERLCRDPLGAALWRAAIAEEMVAAYQARETERERATTSDPASRQA